MDHVQTTLKVLKRPYKVWNFFSPHYIENRLKKSKIWKEGDRANKEAYTQISQLFKKNRRQFEYYNEAQLEENFIRPILSFLGHCFEVQPPIRDVFGIFKTPDYAFFTNKKEQDEALRCEDTYFSTAIALGEAKAWDENLDGRKRRENPSAQINTYLRISGVRWGILTNGRIWRIYCKDTSFRLKSFFEVDLIYLLEHGSLDEFKNFYLFFRKDAFVLDKEKKSLLDLILEESIHYATQISGDIKENVYEALKELCEGFLQYEKNQLKESDLSRIHNSALILLYRILFILYAEARELLPLDNNIYIQYSLDLLKRDIAGILDDPHRSYHPWDVFLWERLRNLFFLVNEGSENQKIPSDELFVPAYNGGLFDPNKYPFLESYKIPDTNLAQAIDLLARSRPQKGKQSEFIDYQTLEIRHLGSIYEGLLEFRVEIAEEDLVSVKKKGKEIYITLEEAKEKGYFFRNENVIEKGSLYPVAGQGERKATGSYYTPDYIVRYIVEHALTPLIEEMQKQYEDNAELIDAILGLNILDPAMGSGHFLVEATNFLSQKIIEFASQSKTDFTGETIDEIKRKVVERCIYGVDINPLAVELAKVSLWLDTISKDAPLNFLDHHLMCGNSLIGAKVDDLFKVLPATKLKGNVKPETQKSFSFKALQEKMREILPKLAQIQTLPSKNASDIKQKESLFEEISEDEKQFIELANTYMSAFFGNKVSQAQYDKMLGMLKEPKEEWDKLRKKDWFKKAQQIAEKRRFFHWEFAFPEIFFKSEGPEFHAVIGNPPYGRYHTLDKMERDYIRGRRLSFGSGDISEAFIHVSFLLSKYGNIGMIVPKVLTYVSNWRGIRRLLKKSLVYIADVSKAFEDVLYEQIIFGTCGKSDPKAVAVSGIIGGSIEELHHVSAENFSDDFYPLYLTNENEGIKEKIETCSSSLGKIYNYWYGKGGVIPKLSTEPSGAEILQGRDIDRYTELEHSRNFLSVDYLSQEEISKNEIEKIVVQDIVAHITKPFPHIKITSTIDANGRVALNTLTCVSQKSKDYSLTYLLSLLNSRLISWYVHHFIFNLAIRTMHYMPGYIERTPVRKISFSTLPSEQTKLLEKMKSLYEIYLSTKDQTQLLRFIESCASLEKCEDSVIESDKSDVIHDFLSFLSQKMLCLHEERDKEKRGFLRWLERELHVPIANLAKKKELKDYQGLTFIELLDTLKLNRKKIALDLDNREIQERIERELEASLSKLIPLVEAIELTDQLINQIVYRSYGLKEEEIAVLESFTGYY